MKLSLGTEVKTRMEKLGSLTRSGSEVLEC